MVHCETLFPLPFVLTGRISIAAPWERQRVRYVRIFMGGHALDSTRFDNMTRLLGAGVNRRKVLRGLLGGAGALAVTGATRQFAGAQGICEVREDCVNVQQEGSDVAGCDTLCGAGKNGSN